MSTHTFEGYTKENIEFAMTDPFFYAEYQDYISGTRKVLPDIAAAIERLKEWKGVKE